MLWHIFITELCMRNGSDCMRFRVFFSSHSQHFRVSLVYVFAYTIFIGHVFQKQNIPFMRRSKGWCCMVKFGSFFSHRCAHLYLWHIFQYILIMWCHWFSCISKPVKFAITDQKSCTISIWVFILVCFSSQSVHVFLSPYLFLFLFRFSPHFYHCTWSKFNKPFKTFAPMQRIHHQCNFTTSSEDGEKNERNIF